MKEKFLSFFTGKTLYVTVASILVCTIAVGGSIIAVKVNNNKLQKALEGLSTAITEQTESTTEESTESTSESLTATTVTSPNVQQVKSEYGDKGILYLKEYDKLTETYKAKKAELEGRLGVALDLATKETSQEQNTDYEPELLARIETPWGGYAETEEEYQRRVKQYEIDHAAWEQRKIERDVKEQSKRQDNNNIEKQISDLDAEYQKGINSLKLKYGIK